MGYQTVLTFNIAIPLRQFLPAHRQNDFSDLQLRRLDPIKQQTTPRKILNNGMW